MLQVEINAVEELNEERNQIEIHSHTTNITHTHIHFKAISPERFNKTIHTFQFQQQSSQSFRVSYE